MEQTLIIFKPDALQRGVVGEILTRFEKTGLKLVGMKMLTASDENLHGHYEGIGKLKTRKGDEIFQMTLAMMKDGPVVAAVLEGIEAADLVRKLVGPTEPKSAPPGTIRGDYAHVSYGHADSESIGIPNLVHASGDAAEAKLEVALWFTPEELFSYATTHDKFTQPKKS